MWLLYIGRIVVELIGATVLWLIVWIGLYVLSDFLMRQRGQTGFHSQDMLFYLVIVAVICAVDTVWHIERRRASKAYRGRRRIKSSGWE